MSLLAARRTLAVFALVVASGCSFLYEFDRLPEEVVPGDIVGRAVRKGTGADAPFAHINVHGSPTVRRADALGNFRIGGLPPGGWLLTLSDDANGNGEPERFAQQAVLLVNAQHPEGLFDEGESKTEAVLLGTVSLGGTARLAGRVVDASGASVPGAKVFIVQTADLPSTLNPSPENLQSLILGIVAHGGTDDSGRFSVPGVPETDPDEVVKTWVLATWIDDSDPENPIFYSALTGPYQVNAELDPNEVEPLQIEPTDVETTNVDVAIAPPEGQALSTYVIPTGASSLDPGSRFAFLDPQPVSSSVTGDGVITVEVPVGLPFDLFVLEPGGDSRRGLITSQIVVPGLGAPGARLGPVVMQLPSPCFATPEGRGEGPRDCDGDGVRGIPPRADDEALWDECASQCGGAFGIGGAVALCRYDDEAWDCDDDGDGQPDATEPDACYGVHAGGDRDGDGVCDPADPYPLCASDAPEDQTGCDDFPLGGSDDGDGGVDDDGGVGDGGVGDAGVDGGVDECVVFDGGDDSCGPSLECVDGRCVASVVPVGLASADTYSCAVAGGAVDCRRSVAGSAEGIDGTFTSDDGVAFKAISTGKSHVCAVTETGHLYCWGANNSGQALPPECGSSGNNAPGYFAEPARVGFCDYQNNGMELPDGITVVSVSAGDDHTCALVDESTVDGGLDIWCWGLVTPALGFVPPAGNEAYAGRVERRPAAEDPQQSVGWRSVSVGSDYACATDDVGRAWCWGTDPSGNGRLGAAGPSTEPREVPVPAGTRFSTVETGKDHTCALTDDDASALGTNERGEVWCWGDNASLQLGRTMDGGSAPASIDDVTRRFEKLTLGRAHTCGIGASDGRAYCFGDNGLGQVTGMAVIGETNSVPEQYPVVGPFKDITAGSNKTCATPVEPGPNECWGDATVPLVLPSSATWTGAVSTDANVAANWSTGIVPSADTALIFNNTGTRDCDLDALLNTLDAPLRSVTISPNVNAAFSHTVSATDLTISGSLIDRSASLDVSGAVTLTPTAVKLDLSATSRVGTVAVELGDSEPMLKLPTSLPALALVPNGSGTQSWLKVASDSTIDQLTATAAGVDVILYSAGTDRRTWTVLGHVFSATLSEWPVITATDTVTLDMSVDMAAVDVGSAEELYSRFKSDNTGEVIFRPFNTDYISLDEYTNLVGCLAVNDGVSVYAEIYTAGATMGCVVFDHGGNNTVWGMGQSPVRIDNLVVAGGSSVVFQLEGSGPSVGTLEVSDGELDLGFAGVTAETLILRGASSIIRLGTDSYSNPLTITGSMEVSDGAQLVANKGTLRLAGPDVWLTVPDLTLYHLTADYPGGAVHIPRGVTLTVNGTLLLRGEPGAHVSLLPEPAAGSTPWYVDAAGGRVVDFVDVTASTNRDSYPIGPRVWTDNGTSGWASSCGDGVLGGDEECDEGAAQNGATPGVVGSCSSACTVEVENTYVWRGLSGNDPLEPDNWEPNTGPPGVADRVVFDAQSPDITFIGDGDEYKVIVTRPEFTKTVTLAQYGTVHDVVHFGGTLAFGFGGTPSPFRFERFHQVARVNMGFSDTIILGRSSAMSPLFADGYGAGTVGIDALGPATHALQGVRFANLHMFGDTYLTGGGFDVSIDGPFTVSTELYLDSPQSGPDVIRFVPRYEPFTMTSEGRLRSSPPFRYAGSAMVELGDGVTAAAEGNVTLYENVRLSELRLIDDGIPSVLSDYGAIIDVVHQAGGETILASGLGASGPVNVLRVTGGRMFADPSYGYEDIRPLRIEVSGGELNVGERSVDVDDFVQTGGTFNGWGSYAQYATYTVTGGTHHASASNTNVYDELVIGPNANFNHNCGAMGSPGDAQSDPSHFMKIRAGGHSFWRLILSTFSVELEAGSVIRVEDSAYGYGQDEAGDGSGLTIRSSVAGTPATVQMYGNPDLSFYSAFRDVVNTGPGYVGRAADPGNSVKWQIPLDNSCGNGVLDDGEECDLGTGNGPFGSGCSAACTAFRDYECSGTVGGPSTCSRVTPFCGNGIIDGNEQCDDMEATCARRPRASTSFTMPRDCREPSRPSNAATIAGCSSTARMSPERIRCYSPIRRCSPTCRCSWPRSRKLR